MKLTSLWTQGPVFWRVFDWNDNAAELLKVGNAQGLIGGPGQGMAWSDPRFQMELKRDSLNGAYILHSSPNRLFLQGRHYVLRNDGTVGELEEPTLLVTSPASNATLRQSRLNAMDRLIAVLNLRDRFGPGLGDYLADVEVFFYIRYPRQSEIPIQAQRVPQAVLGPTASFAVDYKFPRPGPVEITCRIVNPQGKRRASAWVPAQVADTGSRTISVQFTDPIPGATPPTFPAIASTIRAKLITRPEDQDYFGLIEYRFGPVGGPYTTLIRASALPTPSGTTTREWPVALNVLANAAPGRYSLIVRDVDAFNEEDFRSYTFELRDVTPPRIVINEPRDGQVYVTNDPTTLVIRARGSVSDEQTAVNTASVAWTIGGPPQAVGGPIADWYAELRPGAYGAFSLDVTARDSATPAPNTGGAVSSFTVVSAYKPATLQELLSPQSYLQELLRFAARHLIKGSVVASIPINSPDLEENFFQPFQKLSWPNSPESVEVTSDVLVPIRLLRARDRLIRSSAIDLDTAAALAADAALVARWDFSELSTGATDGLIERFRGFGPFRFLGRYESSAGVQAIGQSAQNLTGRAGSPEEGGFRSTGTSRIVIGASGAATGWTARALALGRDNRDFSLAFWIRPEDSGSGAWRGVVFKGTESSAALADWRRTPGIWLHRSENRVHFRISTDYGNGGANEGGDSAAVIQAGTWTHLAYVKSGRRLRLYLNGLLDQEVVLRSPNILYSDDPFYLGANPHYAGFVGALSEFRVYATALGDDEVRTLAQDRRAAVPNVGSLQQVDTGTVLHRYCYDAYDALLRGLGTSRAELATIGSLSGDERRALELRLGLAGLPWRPRLVLEALVPRVVPSNPADVQQFELFLADNFGLPFTFWQTPNSVQAPGGTPLVLQHRQAGLEEAYAREDAEPSRWPDLDPDLVDFEELDPAADAWRQLHIARSGELAAQFRLLSNPNLTADGMLAVVYNASERRQLKQLGRNDAAGLPIVDGLATLSLDLPMLRQVLTCLATTSSRPLSALQRTDLAHLLVEVWKRRARRATWVQEESMLSTRPWPGVAGPGAWIPGRYRRDFLPWRGNMLRRVALEDRLGARHRAFDALLQAHTRLLLDVQRSTLPRLRDELLGIGDLPTLAPRLGALQQMLLTDLTAAGGLDLSVVEQATASLQVLFNGIRRAWFSPGHPAWTWRPKDANNFDAQWNGIDTYGRWRSSVLNYLYVENILYPELRGSNSADFKDCLLKLRAIQPLTVAALEDAAKPYGQAVGLLRNKALASQALALEANFFLPVAEGLALQRAAQFEAALRSYAKVLDVSKPLVGRRLVRPVVDERVGEPASAAFVGLDWAARLQDPHERAVGKSAGCQNPYTRFVLFQILHCTLALAETALASGTLDDRALARALFLEAEDVLAFDELVDVPPLVGGQAYLPNPLLEAYRARAASGLRKLRLGLSVLGTPLPPDPTRGAGAAGLSSLVRPTSYRYRVLIDRAKQQAGMAQQFEAQYLAAIERNEAELEKLMQQGFAVELASQTVELRRLGITEAETGEWLAVLQEGRSRIEQDRLKDWLAVGDNYYERQQISAMAAATDWRQLANAAQTVAAVASSSGAAAAGAVKSFGVASGFYVGAAVAQAAAGIAQGFVIDKEASAQAAGLYGSRQRRDEEWRLRRDLAEQDGRISAQGVKLAGDRLAIARQDMVIAEAQATQAAQMFAFQRNKFTNAEFYDWLAGVLAETYGFFLQLAAAAARQAELQLAFERQEAPQGLLRADYWKFASSDGQRDRRGITGSARLLQDLYTLDQYAFSSERRLLNLTQSFSAERLMPVELEEFRRTGVMTFTTPMAWFDDGFPGHYLRLVKRVRVSIAALIPPSVGIRATLSNGGLSRVVTADPGYPTMVIRQDPQSVALTSPNAATGVFELDMQSELLFPFEGTGVDTSWLLELPRAANLFDFDSLMDVVVSIDYTALSSLDLRERVIKSLPRETAGDRVISVRRDLPDVWYELANGQGTSAQITLPVGRRLFPPGIEDVQIRELSLSAFSREGAPCAFVITPSKTLGAVTTVAEKVAAVRGIASSRQSGASAWRTPNPPQPAALLPSGVEAEWRFVITNDLAGGNTHGSSLLEQLRDGTVEDVLIVFGFTGRRPPWRVY